MLSLRNLHVVPKEIVLVIRSPLYLPFPTGIKRGLTERMYTAISSDQDTTYPDRPVVYDAHKISINELLQNADRD